jgi:hypothetical protein
MSSEDLAQLFLEGGWGMYPLAFLACALPLMGLAFLVVALLSKRNLALPLGVALLVAAVLPPALGSGARAQGRAAMEEALLLANPDDRDTIRMAGEAELMVLTIAGFGAALLPGFLSFLLLGLGLGRGSRFAPVPPA